MDQDLVVDCISARIETPRWWKPMPYLNLAEVGPDFLRELMETYYSIASFEFGIEDHEMEVDFDLGLLLAKDIFRSTRVPAKYIKTITIDVVLFEHGVMSRASLQHRELLVPPVKKARINGTICSIVFRGLSNADLGSISSWGVRSSILNGVELLKRFSRVIRRMTEMVIDIQMIYRGELVYPLNRKAEAVEMKTQRQTNKVIVTLYRH
jgi:hypothetical protein